MDPGASATFGASGRGTAALRPSCFRVVSGLAVLAGCGNVWSDHADVDLQRAAAATDVDVFVSHSWAADRRAKHLAVCYFLNIGIAVKATIAAVIFSQGVFVLYPNQSIHMLFFSIMDFPVIVFFLAFFFAQHLTCGSCCPSFWVDKLCIDQKDEVAKQQGISQVPQIVSKSLQLLVLWDETYFTRLWCNLELSIFVTRNGVRNVHLIPLWLAPWLLTTMLILYMEGRLVAYMWEQDPEIGIEVDAGHAKASGLMYGLKHMNDLLEYAPFYALLYMPLVLISLGPFQAKLDGHAKLLEDMESFDIRDAKCSVEEDRRTVQAQVADLQQEKIAATDSDDSDGWMSEEEATREEARRNLPQTEKAVSLLPVHPSAELDDCLNSFNNFVRGPLRDAIINDWGFETNLPWQVCLLAWLPTMLCLTAVTWSSIPHYKEMGFASLAQYYAVGCLELAVVHPICLPLAYPFCLRALRWASCLGEGPLRQVLASLSGLAVLFAVEAVAVLLNGSLESFAFTGHPLFLAIFAVLLAPGQHTK